MPFDDLRDGPEPAAAATTPPLSRSRRRGMLGLAVLQTTVLLLGLEHFLRTQDALVGLIAVSSWTLVPLVGMVLSGLSTHTIVDHLRRPPKLYRVGLVRLFVFLPVVQTAGIVVLVGLLTSLQPETYSAQPVRITEGSWVLDVVLLVLIAYFFELVGVLLTLLVVMPLQWLPTALSLTRAAHLTTLPRFGPLLAVVFLLGLLPLSVGLTLSMAVLAGIGGLMMAAPVVTLSVLGLQFLRTRRRIARRRPH